MESYLADIGFHVHQSGDMEALAVKFFAQGHRVCLTEGSYLHFEAGNGVELWGQLNAAEELIGFNPHFAGKTRVTLGILNRIHREGFAMDGGFKCIAQPFGNNPIQGAFPVVVDAPDFLTHAQENFPAIRTLQLSAFVQQCAFFENEADYRAHSSRFGSKLNPDAFVALGLIDEKRELRTEPLATAVIVGQVLEAQQLQNPATTHPFWWMRVRNAVGELDVVADPELLQHGVKIGQVIQCSAWLSGRLM